MKPLKVLGWLQGLCQCRDTLEGPQSMDGPHWVMSHCEGWWPWVTQGREGHKGLKKQKSLKAEIPPQPPKPLNPWLDELDRQYKTWWKYVKLKKEREDNIYGHAGMCVCVCVCICESVLKCDLLFFACVLFSTLMP